MANNESDDLDTGMPGFVVDGRLHQMTPGDPSDLLSSDPISPSEKKGRLSEVNLTGDIPKTTRNTLADYLGKSTTRKNYYPLDGETFNQGVSFEKRFGNQVRSYTTLSADNPLINAPIPPPSSREISITSPGNTHVPRLEPPINTNYFAEPDEMIPSEVSPELQGWFTSEESSIDIGVPSLPVIKGRSPGWDAQGNVNGNNLLRDTMDPSTPSFAATEKALRVLSRNRFVPGVSLDPSIEYSVDIPIMHIKDSSAAVGTSFRSAWARNDEGIIEGSFHAESLNSGSFYNPPLHNPKYPGMRANDMALASDILLNGAKFDGKDAAKQYESMSDVYAALTYGDELNRDINFISLGGGDLSKKIKKNDYTSSRMFDGASDVVMVGLATLLLLEVADIIDEKISNESIQDYFLLTDKSLESSFRYCVGRGIDVFYDNDGSTGNDKISVYDTIDSSDKTTRSRSWLRTKFGIGYGNNGILVETSRSIIKAVDDYNMALLKANASDGLSSAKIFGQSKLAKILIAFSKIGEAQIERERRESQSQKTSLSLSTHDGMKVNTNLGLISKWASHNAFSLFLKDVGLEGINSPVSTKSKGMSLLSTHSRSQSIEMSRFSTDMVKQMEEFLNSDYMPFYFHDLRTNEIINFHAFLSSLSDGFSASYDSIEGFGRVEPIKIYKGTQRKISMEFSIVATSKDDFEIMWHKINKLVTLVYPQYTEGRRLEKNGYNFVQPFSQMMGASPLIRIRLGNLLRSNYSRFALAKLFGAGLENSSFERNENEVKAIEKKAEEKRVTRSRERNLAENKEKIAEKINEYSKTPQIGFLYLIKNHNSVNFIDKKLKPKFKSLFRFYPELAANLCCRVEDVTPLPRRTVTKNIVETRTVLDEQANLERDERESQRIESLKARDSFIKEKQAAAVELEKAKKQFVENASREYKSNGNRWGIEGTDRRREIRERKLQQQSDVDAIAAANLRLNEAQSGYEANENFINSLDEYVDSRDPILKEENVTITKTYRWTPLLVKLSMSIQEDGLDDVLDPEKRKILLEQLKTWKESWQLGDDVTNSSNLGILDLNNITLLNVETLSGNLKLSNKQIQAIENEIIGAPPSESPAVETPPTAETTKKIEDIDPLIEFMKPENNSLVKSFEEAGGKGLAGVIESLDFTWLDQAVWDVEDKDKMAPMMCKVSISFAPIHDISPGLDSMGRNRAPVYPVGLAHIPERAPIKVSSEGQGDEYNNMA